MVVQRQLNLSDRTLVVGIPTFDKIPKKVLIHGEEFKVIGLSGGVKLPYVSLEIERTESKLTGERIISK